MRTGSISYLRLLACLCGVVMLHAGGNAANDCYDYILGADKITTAGRYSGGSGVMPQKLVTVRDAKAWFLLLLAGSVAFAAGLSRGVDWQPFFLGLAGVAASLSYSLPPLKLSYRGFGELLVALTFGPGIMVGTFYVLRSYYSLQVLAIGAVVGVLIGSVQVVNQMRDIESDIAAGKHTLAVRLKLKGIL